MVVVDDLLRPEALAANGYVGAWCREATIWKRTGPSRNKEGRQPPRGRLRRRLHAERSRTTTPTSPRCGPSSRARPCASSPVQPCTHLQLEETAAREPPNQHHPAYGMPRIMKDHRLEQCWAFKCDNTKKGVNLHADVAAVNVKAGLDRTQRRQRERHPEQGGLTSCGMWSHPHRRLAVRGLQRQPAQDAHMGLPRGRLAASSQPLRPCASSPVQPCTHLQLDAVSRDGPDRLPAGLREPPNQHHPALRHPPNQ